MGEQQRVARVRRRLRELLDQQGPLKRTLQGEGVSCYWLLAHTLAHFTNE